MFRFIVTIVIVLIVATVAYRQYLRSNCVYWETAIPFVDAAYVKRCLESGSDIEARSEGGWTPLHVAAQLGTSETIIALIKAGVDITARDRANKLPWHYAEQNDKIKGTDAYWRLREAQFR